MEQINLKILGSELLDRFVQEFDSDLDLILENIKDENVPVDYFKFYHAISSVYSSKIEGEEIDFDSFFKHKFMNVGYKPDYTKKADDLVLAYEFALENDLNLKNVLIAHEKLSDNLLPKGERGKIRNNPMFVLNSEDRIEYVATDPKNVKIELDKLFEDISILINSSLTTAEVFYFASYIHLAFVKIHPLQDGNGRTARLIEKWFLCSKLGAKIVAIDLEKNYYTNSNMYYKNIKVLGLEYEKLEYKNAYNFLCMTVKGAIKQGKKN